MAEAFNDATANVSVDQHQSRYRPPWSGRTAKARANRGFVRAAAHHPPKLFKKELQSHQREQSCHNHGEQSAVRAKFGRGLLVVSET